MLFDVSVQTLPFFGVVPAILNESGEELEGESEGYLVSWDWLSRPRRAFISADLVVPALRCLSSRGPA